MAVLVTVHEIIAAVLAAAEQRERVANVTDGVAGEGLGVVSTRARTHRGAGLASM